MSGHRDTGLDAPEPRTGQVPRRREPAESAPTPVALVLRLQRLAGNQAVARLMQRSRPGPVPLPVQRDGFGYRPPAENPYQLHLDPEIEAQIRAIQVMRALVAPPTVQEGLREVNLNLPPMPAPTGPQAPPIGPPPAAPAP